MSKHTKGPWTIDPVTGSIDDANGTPLFFAVGKWYGEENPAHHNARLIAAAPELLEAAKEVRAWFDTDGYANSVPPRVLVDYLSSAIAKAESK